MTEISGSSGDGESAAGEHVPEDGLIGFWKIQPTEFFVRDPSERTDRGCQIRKTGAQNASPEVKFNVAVRIGMFHCGQMLSRNHNQSRLFATFANGAGPRRFVGVTLTAGKLRLARQRNSRWSLTHENPSGGFHDGYSDSFRR